MSIASALGVTMGSGIVLFVTIPFHQITATAFIVGLIIGSWVLTAIDERCK